METELFELVKWGVSIGVIFALVCALVRSTLRAYYRSKSEFEIDMLERRALIESAIKEGEEHDGKR